MIATRTAARSIRRRPGQALLVGVAIIAATAFAAAALLIAVNARSALIAFGMSTPQGADAVLTLGQGVDADEALALADAVRDVNGVDGVFVESLGDVDVEAGARSSVWKLTSDPGTGPLSSIDELDAGSAPGDGEILLGMNTAERVGTGVGDVVVAEGRELVVSGIAPVHEFGMDVGFVSEASAAALGEAMMPVQLLVGGDADLDDLRAVAGDATVAAGEDRRAQESRSVTDTLVGVLGGLAVFVALAILSAGVIVASTFRILLARRAAELALLRCVGATRRQVRRAVLVEAAGIGLLAGVIGVALGLGVAAALVAGARAAGLLAEQFVAAPAGLVGCLALAVVSSVLAALPAARAAGRTAPVTALGDARSSEAGRARLGSRLAVAGGFVVAAGAAGAGGALVSRTDQATGLALAAVSGVLVFGALIAVGPLLVRGAATVLGPLAERSAAFRLAASNAKRASRRTAAMTTVLTLGVGLTAALVVGVAGATEDARDSVERNFPSAAIIPVDLVEDPAATTERLAAHDDLEASLGEHDILVDPVPGTDQEALRTAVLDRLEPGDPVYWASDVLEGIEQTILIGQVVGAAMIGVTLLVALIGVAVTLSLSVTERRTEIALLRALGVSRAGARRSIAAEAAIAAIVGAATGVVIGGGYGVLALRVLGMAPGPPPVGALAALVAGVVATAVLAAVVPMRSAGRVPPAIGVAAR